MKFNINDITQIVYYSYLALMQTVIAIAVYKNNKRNK